METKMEVKAKDKAIIGIAIAVIILALVFVAMVTPAAAFVRQARTVYDSTGAPPIAIGELVWLMGPDGNLNTADDPTTLQKLEGSPAVPIGDVVSRTTEGFDTTGALPGTYQSNQGGTVTLVNPQLELSLRLGGTNTEISSVVVGQPIATVVSTNIPQSSPAGTSDNTLKVKIIDQKTGIKTTAGVTATNIPMWTVSTGPGGLPSGSYTITVMTSETGGAAIDFRSETKDMVVRTQEIDLEAELTEQVSGNDVLITVKAGSGVPVTVALSGATGRFNPNKGDVPSGNLNLAQTIFTRNVPADGTLEAVISSTTTGAVEVRATVTGTTVTDTIDVSFRKPTTTVTVSTTKFTIGDKVTIEGITNSGVDAVAIFVDDVLQREVAIEADGTYKWEWDTSLGLIEGPTYIGRSLKPGALTIKIFEIHVPADLPANGNPQNLAPAVPALPQPGDGLDRDCGGDGPVVANLPQCSFYDPANTANKRPADASAVMLAVEGELTATMDALRVAKGDDMVVKGTAAGEYLVRVILIAWDGVVLMDTLESVAADHIFEYSMLTNWSWNSGEYKIMVINDGIDDKTLLTGGCDIMGWGNCPAMPTQDGIWDASIVGAEQSGRLFSPSVTIGGSLVSDMTQSQLIATIEKLLNSPGSDDKLVVLSFSVEAPSIKIGAIEPVAVGEPLCIRGTTNREPGTNVVIWAVEGPTELPTPVLTEVEWTTPDTGAFSALIDTTCAVPGNYTFEAYDDKGNGATAHVEILVPAPPKPEVSISIDRAEYSPGDVMNTSIRLSNPADSTQDVLFEWYLGVPDYNFSTQIMETDVSLTADSDMTVSIPVGDWGTGGFCGFLITSLTNTTTQKVVSVDSAIWIYMPCAESESKTPAEIVNEIEKIIEGVELPVSAQKSVD